MVDLKHELIRAGHAAFFTPWLIPDYGMNVRSITSYLRRTEADAWIVAAGARPLLEWYVQEEVPEDVSLICTDGDPHFAWCRPSVAHIQWDTAPVVRRALRWADNVARSKPLRGCSEDEIIRNQDSHGGSASLMTLRVLGPFHRRSAAF